MARIDFPDGEWVEYRDELSIFDKYSVDEAVQLGYNGHAGRMCLGMINDMRAALLGRVITDWSFSVPVPAEMADVMDPKELIGEVMPLKDYVLLTKAIQPLLDLMY